MSRGLSDKRITSWLEQTLIPVEPRPQFVGRLKGRLVSFKGSSVASRWVLISMAGMVILMVVASLGLALRLLFGLIALIGLLRRRREQRRAPAMVTTAS